MLWLSIALATIISLAALAYVLWPILRPGPAPVLVEDDRLTDLLARKDAVLASIKELEFDYYVGKIGDEDFDRFDERLRRQAIGLLQQIEKVAPESAGLDERLEREIARLRKTQDRGSLLMGAAPAPDGEIAASVSVRPARPIAQPAPEAPPLRYCTNCGEALNPAHKFCGHCGTPVTPAVTSPVAGQTAAGS